MPCSHVSHLVRYAEQLRRNRSLALSFPEQCSVRLPPDTPSSPPASTLRRGSSPPGASQHPGRPLEAGQPGRRSFWSELFMGSNPAIATVSGSGLFHPWPDQRWNSETKAPHGYLGWGRVAVSTAGFRAGHWPVAQLAPRTTPGTTNMVSR